MNYLNKKGFTLIELIVVIAIIAILMLILVPTMNGFVNQAKIEANFANAKAVYTALIAQDAAARAGMEYNPIKASSLGSDGAYGGEACSAAGLSPDFYGEDLVNTECYYDKQTNGIFVTWAKGTDFEAIYPMEFGKGQ